MADREFCMIVVESALNVAKTSPVAGTEKIFVRLTDGNALNMYAKPVIEEIAYGGGLAITGEAVSDHYECAGQLKTKLYPAQAALLMNWAITRVGSGTPWTTTEPPGDLASCSVYHAYTRSNGTLVRKQYSGVKVAGWRVEFSRQATTGSLTLDLIASKSQGNAMDGTSDPTSTVFPAPAASDYPLGPYTFKMSSGGLTVASVRSQYEDLTIAGQNAIDGRWFEQSYRQILQFCGRSTTLEATLLLKATPDDRTAYEAITANTASLVLAHPTTGYTMTLTFNGNNVVTDLPWDLPLDKVFTNKMTLKNLYDSTALSDVSVAFS